MAAAALAAAAILIAMRRRIGTPANGRTTGCSHSGSWNRVKSGVSAMRPKPGSTSEIPGLTKSDLTGQLRRSHSRTELGEARGSRRLSPGHETRALAWSDLFVSDRLPADLPLANDEVLVIMPPSEEARPLESEPRRVSFRTQSGRMRAFRSAFQAADHDDQRPHGFSREGQGRRSWMTRHSRKHDGAGFSP